MSKDKGGKNSKKPKADKAKGKKKAVSAYKSESQKGKNQGSNLEVFTPKSDNNGDSHKKKQ